MAQPWYRKLFSHAPEVKHEEPPMEVEVPPVPQGSAAAQFALGLHRAAAHRPDRDYAEAAQWYLKAADRNHALAQFNLGVMFGAGQGVPRDAAQAEMWFRRAAEAGDAGAQHRMGSLCEQASYREMGAMESRIEAYKWYALAAAKGYAGANVAKLTLTLRMTREDVAQSRLRIQAFRLKTEPEEIPLPAATVQASPGAEAGQ